MDFSKMKNSHDNGLFRYLSKSYSKAKSSLHPEKYCTIQKLPNSFTNNLKNSKVRSQSSSVYKPSIKIQHIGSNNQISKPGFLKYRNLSMNESLPLNASMHNSKELDRYSLSFKTIDGQFSHFKRTINGHKFKKQRSQDFGLRNLAGNKQQYDQLMHEESEYSILSRELSQQVLLCDQSHRMFQGKKSLNLNNFIITQNINNLRKGRRNTIKQSIFRRKVNDINRRELKNRTLK